jgi:NTP pyrophosphatase (non-canonical NTP hydrolase)
MEMKELKEIIKWETDRLTKAHPGSKRDHIFWATLKLPEEVGEVVEQVLASEGFQRQCKIDAYEKQDLSHELADVVLVTMILAERLGIDIEEALKEKIEIVRKRAYKGETNDKN